MPNYYAIKFTGKRQYMIIGFHSEGERDTFIKYACPSFMPIANKQVRKYIPNGIVRLCNCYIKTVFDNEGKRRSNKAHSLYKPIHEQKQERPEDSVILTLPKVKSKSVADKTTAHNYRMEL